MRGRDRCGRGPSPSSELARRSVDGPDARNRRRCDRSGRAHALAAGTDGSPAAFGRRPWSPAELGRATPSGILRAWRARRAAHAPMGSGPRPRDVGDGVANGSTASPPAGSSGASGRSRHPSGHAARTGTAAPSARAASTRSAPPPGSRGSAGRVPRDTGARARRAPIGTQACPGDHRLEQARFRRCGHASNAAQRHRGRGRSPPTQHASPSRKGPCSDEEA
jgi:hypothetical protein